MPATEFRAQLLDKVHHLETELTDLKASMEATKSQTLQVVADKSEAFRKSADARKHELEAAHKSFQERMAEFREEATTKIHDWKEKREKNKLLHRADKAEKYAEASIIFALAAIREAAISTVDAVEARLAADAAESN